MDTNEKIHLVLCAIGYMLCIVCINYCCCLLEADNTQPLLMANIQEMSGNIRVCLYECLTVEVFSFETYWYLNLMCKPTEAGWYY